MEINKGRQSNIELLRIVAMLFIILHHVSVHTAWGNNGVYFPEPLTFNMFFLQGMLPLGKIGVDIFILISGYFLVNSTKSAWPKMVEFWLQMLFYSVLISLLFGMSGREFSAREIISVVTPVISSVWWFASAYAIMLLVSPFLNKMIHACSATEHLRLILGLTIIWCLVPLFTGIRLEYVSLCWFIALYLIGAFVRLHPDCFKRPAKQYFALAAGIFCLLMIVYYIIDVIDYSPGIWGISNPIQNLNEMSGITATLISLFLFLGFRNMEIRYSKLINTVGGTTFGIYLLHDHVLVREYIYNTFFGLPAYTDSAYLFLIVAAVLAIIFTVCSLIEFIRKYLADRFIRPHIYELVPKIETRWSEFIQKKINP